jgi:predicted permease
MMTRSTARRREIAVRLTLGATRARLVRQLLTEGAVLSFCGGALGIVFARWGLGALIHVLPAARVPTSVDANLDARSLVFSLALSMLTALLFSAGPALRSTRPDLAGAIRAGSDSITARMQRTNGRKILVAVQVALSLVLVIGASLFARSLAHVAAIPLGFETDNVIIASIDPSLSGYKPGRVRRFYHELESRLVAIAGVRAVGFSAFPLLGGEMSMRTITGPGAPDATNLQSTLVTTNTVGGDFFAAAGIQLRRGRGFDARDSLRGPRVVVLNEAAARHYFPGDNAAGRTVLLGGAQPATVIGVVSDTKYVSVREENPRIVYFPADQDPGVMGGGERTIYVRTTGSASRFAGDLESAVRDLDKTIPLYNVKTLATQKSQALVRERLVAALSTLAGSVALALAAIALYGLISFGAVSRTREIGIRVSLGADRASVIWLIIRGAAGMVIGGCIAGLGLGLLLSRFVRAHLYGVSPTDALTMGMAVGVLMCTAIAAALLPALRASRIDPTEALRCE